MKKATFSLTFNRIYNENCLDTMAKMPDGFIDCCITSPPYYGLRDYGHADQIGLEETPDMYVQKLVEVFREVKRILKSDGTLWLNLGDSYARVGGDSSIKGRHWDGREQNPNTGHNRYAKDMGLKPKDLIGIPWMVAFALRADGWYLRQDIIWHKPNPMPESVTDRCTKSHEYIFLMSKSQKYFYDAESIKEPLTSTSVARLSQNVDAQAGSGRVPFKTNGNMKAVARGETRNKRSVWTITTKPYSGAHFATFPEDLIVPMIKAGSPEGGIVYDPFGGAATTGLVAHKLDRNWIISELSKEYCNIGEKRLQPYLSQHRINWG